MKLFNHPSLLAFLLGCISIADAATPNDSTSNLYQSGIGTTVMCKRVNIDTTSPVTVSASAGTTISCPSDHPYPYGFYRGSLYTSTTSSTNQWVTDSVSNGATYSTYTGVFTYGSGYPDIKLYCAKINVVWTAGPC